jgi:hypothetical protein
MGRSRAARISLVLPRISLESANISLESASFSLVVSWNFKGLQGKKRKNKNSEIFEAPLARKQASARRWPGVRAMGMRLRHGS